MPIAEDHPGEFWVIAVDFVFGRAVDADVLVLGKTVMAVRPFRLLVVIAASTFGDDHRGANPSVISLGRVGIS